MPNLSLVAVHTLVNTLLVPYSGKFSRFSRAEQSTRIKTGRNSHAPVFHMQSLWWMWSEYYNFNYNFKMFSEGSRAIPRKFPTIYTVFSKVHVCTCNCGRAMTKFVLKYCMVRILLETQSDLVLEYVVRFWTLKTSTLTHNSRPVLRKTHQFTVAIYASTYTLSGCV